MFGIGLPELILIMGIALIVVGPEKLPELAKGLAKQVVELKKAAHLFKESLNDEVGDEKPWEKDLPMGFSRPEELAAAGRKAIENNKEQLGIPPEDAAVDPGLGISPETQSDDKSADVQPTETDTGKDIDG